MAASFCGGPREGQSSRANAIPIRTFLDASVSGTPDARAIRQSVRNPSRRRELWHAPAHCFPHRHSRARPRGDRHLQPPFRAGESSERSSDTRTSSAVSHRIRLRAVRSTWRRSTRSASPAGAIPIGSPSTAAIRSPASAAASRNRSWPSSSEARLGGLAATRAARSVTQTPRRPASQWRSCVADEYSARLRRRFPLAGPRRIC